MAWTAHPRGGYDELLLSQNNDILSIISDISLENINNNSFYDSILNNLSYSLISNTSFDISIESQTTSFNDVNHNTSLFYEKREAITKSPNHHGSRLAINEISVTFGNHCNAKQYNTHKVRGIGTRATLTTVAT